MEFFGIGKGIPFSFLGIAIALIAFQIIIVIVTGIVTILEQQNIIW